MGVGVGEGGSGVGSSVGVATSSAPLSSTTDVGWATSVAVPPQAANSNIANSKSNKVPNLIITSSVWKISDDNQM
jgi:hypothetical protein